MAKKVEEGFVYSTDATTLDKYIKSIGARASGLLKDVHIALVGAIMHAVEHGNPIYIQRLDDALSDGFWKRGFRTYVNDLGPVEFVKAIKGKDAKPAHWKMDATKRSAIQANMDQHLATMLAKNYHEYTDQKSDSFEGMDLPAMVQALVGRFDKLLKDDTKRVHPKNNIAGLSKLRKLAEDLKGEKPITPTSAPVAALTSEPAPAHVVH